MPPIKERRRKISVKKVEVPAILSPKSQNGHGFDGNASHRRKVRARFTVKRKRDRDGDEDGNGPSRGESDSDDENERGSSRNDFNSQGQDRARDGDDGSGSESEDGEGGDSSGTESDSDDSGDESGSDDEAVAEPPTTIALPSTSTVPLITSTTAEALPINTSPAPTTTTSISSTVPIIPTFTPSDPIIATTAATMPLSIMTTTPLAELTTIRKGVDDVDSPAFTVPFSAITSIEDSPTATDVRAFPAATTDPSYLEKDRDDDDDRDHHGDRDKMRGDPRGLDPTAEHLLIAAGAIGAFILICFIGWIVYRTLKKSKGPGGRGYGFIDKFSRRPKGPMGSNWDGQTMYLNDPPPTYSQGDLAAMKAAGFYGPGKVYPPGPGSLVRSVSSSSYTGTLRKPMANDPPLAGIVDQYALSNGDTMESSEATLRSRMPDAYYNQSELSRQPSDAYNPAQRQVYRASQLSSISSGFGDGDIIVPEPLAVNKPPPAPTSNNAAGRFSWMSRGNGRRETTYTQTSEDRPARFRSVTSWVNQQTGRVQRAEARAHERGEIPVVPAIPGQVAATHQTAYR
ncbi:hypothetical protein F4778DRAFT_778876 [Xylariomycetidae sp. FL2044]|nr:hypothetical protein F4778DRAFT_778876 [Xylariomycetidae sp. FL2044]